MAKLKKNFEFKNAEIDLDSSLIYEFGKGDDAMQTHSLYTVLEEMAKSGRIDLSINITTTPISLESEGE